MKKMFFALFLFAFLAFGQKAEMMDRAAATQAWAAVGMPLPPDTPSITGGGIIVESETNNVGRKVWLVYSQPGAYLLQGKTCNGDEVRLGELQWELNPYSQSGGAMIFDSAAMTYALPFFSQICSIDVLRIGVGRIERSSVEISPWQQPSPIPGPQVVAESVDTGGAYYKITINTPPAEGRGHHPRPLVYCGGDSTITRRHHPDLQDG